MMSFLPSHALFPSHFLLPGDLDSANPHALLFSSRGVPAFHGRTEAAKGFCEIAEEAVSGAEGAPSQTHEKNLQPQQKAERPAGKKPATQPGRVRIIRFLARVQEQEAHKKDHLYEIRHAREKREIQQVFSSEREIQSNFSRLKMRSRTDSPCQKGDLQQIRHAEKET